ncbi:hypothetical protein TNIN_224501, partial [Trichonephila inaurata madagascariensis]
VKINKKEKKEISLPEFKHSNSKTAHYFQKKGPNFLAQLKRKGKHARDHCPKDQSDLHTVQRLIKAWKVMNEPNSSRKACDPKNDPKQS